MHAVLVRIPAAIVDERLLGQGLGANATGLLPLLDLLLHIDSRLERVPNALEEAKLGTSQCVTVPTKASSPAWRWALRPSLICLARHTLFCTSAPKAHFLVGPHHCVPDCSKGIIM